MRKFFSDSFNFWMVSRIIWITLGFISVIQIFSGDWLRNVEFLVNLFFFLYLIFQAICSIKEIRGNKTRGPLNVITGVFSTIIGFALLITFFILGPNRINVPIMLPILLSV